MENEELQQILLKGIIIIRKVVIDSLVQLNLSQYNKMFNQNQVSTLCNIIAIKSA